MANLYRMDRDDPNKKENLILTEGRETARQMLWAECSGMKEEQVRRAWGRRVSEGTSTAGAEEESVR